MIRQILLALILLATPFALYATYVTFVQKKKAETGGTWDEAPLVWLLSAGVALILISLTFLALNTGSEPGSAYRPARLEDGKLVPGEVIPPSDSQSAGDG